MLDQSLVNPDRLLRVHGVVHDVLSQQGFEEC